jgi:hypothetical protein
VKGEWYAPCEHNALIATQVIRMVMCPRVSSLSSVLYIVNPGTALLLRLTAVLATHGITPTGNSSRRRLDTGQAHDSCKAALMFWAPLCDSCVPRPVGQSQRGVFSCIVSIFPSTP